MSSHWLKDLAGQRFGNMIVLGDSGERKNRKVVWKCQCDCGEIFYTRSDRINSGSTKSCPRCAQKKNIENLLESIGKKRKIINPGDKFGKLTIIEQLEEKSSSNSYYLKCQCDCGRITKVDINHWGKTQSCGCIKGEPPKDITGQHFGKLTALYREGRYEKNHSSYWVCECDCGRITKTLITNLTNGHTQSCGLCSMRSKGELKIEQLLKENNIIFEPQKTFDTCRFPNTNSLAKYDFYLPEYNLLIEYDGEQHFSYNQSDNQFWNTEEEFQRIQYRDAYKTQWAKDNNIRLKRIPYYDYKKITLDYLLN